MTDVLSAHSRFHGPYPWLDDDKVTRLWLSCAFLMAAFWMVLTPAFLTDPRTVEGVSTWSKPLKFALSLGVHALTLAVLAQLLHRDDRVGRVMVITGMIGVAGVLFEQVYITLQAARARRSHFNYETDLEGIMYAFMGVGAVMIVLPAFALGLLIWRRSRLDSSALRLGAILGLIIGVVLTSVFGGFMSASQGHWVGSSTTDADGLPIVGWSRSVGDLRVAHFMATHMMQTMPIIGLIVDRMKLPMGKTIVWAAAIIQSAITIAVFAQALAGQPLIGF
ncbi:MAG: hypothetical protein AAGG45_04135 [Pseudomonadota bacterium]